MPSLRSLRRTRRIFQGSELEHYFQSLVAALLRCTWLEPVCEPAFLTILPLSRNFFPLTVDAKPTTKTPGEALLRRTVRESDCEISSLNFSRAPKLDAEIKSLQQASRARERALGELCNKILCRQYLAQAYLWRSHFEESAPRIAGPLGEYPADRAGTGSISVFRSLAYFDPSSNWPAVKIEEHRWQRSGNTQNLARIGTFTRPRAVRQGRSLLGRIPECTWRAGRLSGSRDNLLGLFGLATPCAPNRGRRNSR